jgi:hypothetical protein
MTTRTLPHRKAGGALALLPHNRHPRLATPDGVSGMAPPVRRPRLRAAPRAARVLSLGAALLLASGCVNPGDMQMRDELGKLRETIRQKENQLVAQRATIDELNQQLRVARSINEDDLKRIYYPQEITIDRLTGGADYDGQPGDDGITVYVRPIDQYGDVIKVAGDVLIQLYDLAVPPGQNLIGEYRVPVDKLGELWHGKLMTGHFTIKCPWPGSPPAHNEITVRVTFVDYLTNRVVSAQAVATFKQRP